MRALVFDQSGEVRFDGGYPEPVLQNGDALVRVTHAGICNTDLEIIKGYMGFAGVLGHEFTGVVESAPSKALINKRVVGEINCGCGACSLCKGGAGNHCPDRSVVGIVGRDGAFADYLAIPQKNLHIVPESVPDTEAVFTEPLAAAFEIIKQGLIHPGDRVAVLGDGKLGLLIAQVVALTADDVTLFGHHPDRLKIAQQRGVKTCLTDQTSGSAEHKFDVVIEATGSSDGLGQAIDMIKPCGTIVLKTTSADRSGIDMNRIVIDEIKLVGSRCGPFDMALDALESKAVDVQPLITAVEPLDNGINALHKASNKEQMKVLLDIGSQKLNVE